MTSSYLTRPMASLASALSPLLERIEKELADGQLEAVEQERLHQRGQLIRWLLAQGRVPSTAA